MLKFIDLFAGLGGFHIALSKAGMKCVFASELDPDLRDIYQSNHGLLPAGDITKIKSRDIPKHDVLCAGFPCQPFSNAGKKQGMLCPISGSLIKEVVRITKYHLPKAVILENVPHLLKIDEGVFWKYIDRSFSKLGYNLSPKIISPLDIGVPQNRKRLFLVAIRDEEFKWPSMDNPVRHNGINDWLHNTPDDLRKVNKEKTDLVKHWWELLTKLKISPIPNISILAPEFGANYPLNFEAMSLNNFSVFKGSYGEKMGGSKRWDKVYGKMPSYMKGRKIAPDWVYKSILFSRKLYEGNKKFINEWKKNIPKNYNSWQILEWRGGKKCSNVRKHIIQFRASGVRVMHGNYFPTLVAMTTTQTPIIGSKMRYLSRTEAAGLQGLEGMLLPSNDIKAFKALGNAVNSKIAFVIAKQLKYSLETKR